MGIKESIAGQVSQIVLERPGRKRTLNEWADALATAGAAIDVHAAVATDQSATGRAATCLRHITGIELWGQSRLRVFLGAPLQMDEYDVYAPGVDLDVAALRAAAAAARAAARALAPPLAPAAVWGPQTVGHNGYGPLTVRGWLAYLDTHATREASRIK